MYPYKPNINNVMFKLKNLNFYFNIKKNYLEISNSSQNQNRKN